MDAVKVSAAERKAAARQAEMAHQAKLQRQALDWIEVVKPKRGDILVLRVPNDQFVHPGTKPEDITAEQDATMRSCHEVLGIVLKDCQHAGILLGGAAIIAENMKLEDLPPPWEKHPDSVEQPALQVARSKLILPPGTKI